MFESSFTDAGPGPFRVTYNYFIIIMCKLVD